MGARPTNELVSIDGSTWSAAFVRTMLREMWGIAGIIVDEDHSDDNPDGRVRDSVFQANRVRGTGEHAIVVDDAEDNVFRGNNVNDFESLYERVIFKEDTAGNYYFGNPNLVSDDGQNNTISGLR